MDSSSSLTKERPEVVSTAKEIPEVVSRTTMPVAELHRKWEVRQLSSAEPVSTSGFCYVIVSTSSLTWTILTLVAMALLGVGLTTPYWLLSSPSRRHVLPGHSAANRSDHPLGTVAVGVFSRCTGQRRPEVLDILGALTGAGTSGDVIGECGVFVDGFDMADDEFPNAWKSAVMLFSGATMLMTFTGFTALASVCIQSVFHKSIFTVSGLLQSIAGTRPCTLCSRCYINSTSQSHVRGLYIIATL